MKNYKLKLFSIIIVVFCLFVSHSTFASTTNGTIDSTYRYGWGENVGFIDFGSTSGDVHITDTALSGYAYGENIGWINLTGVTNDKEGHLTGYAWGENVGFIDFSQVVIDNHGYFTGQSYGENIGFITFAKDQANMMITDWRPKSSRHTSSGGGSLPFTPNLVPITQLPTTPIITPSLPTTCPPPILTKTLKLTTPLSKGDDIKQLQTYLNCHQQANLTTDGIFGNKTKQAIILFQKANNLIQDGIVGPITRSFMK